MSNPFDQLDRNSREARRARTAAQPKCRCGNALALGNTTGECPACERLHAPFDEAKAAVADSGVFSEDQVYALHRMIDALRALQ